MVLVTFQVIVCDDEAGHERFVLGCVTMNGPEVAETVTVISV